MGIYNKRRSVPIKELKAIIRKDNGIIPGGKGSRFGSADREKIVRDVFGFKYGDDISKYDYHTAVSRLQQERAKTKDMGQKQGIDKKISYLKKLGGV